MVHINDNLFGNDDCISTRKGWRALKKEVYLNQLKRLTVGRLGIDLDTMIILDGY